MRTFWISFALLFLMQLQIAARAQVAQDPDWMVRGFEAALADKSPGVAEAAVLRWGRLAKHIPPGPRADAATDRLLPLLESSNFDAVQAAATALSALPPGNRTGAILDGMLAVIEKAGDSGSAVAAALGAVPMRDKVDTVIERLLALLRKDGSAQQMVAIEALGALPLPPGARADAVIDELLPLLGSKPTLLRRAAVTALASLGKGNRSEKVAEKLFPLLYDVSTLLRQATAKSLMTLLQGNTGPVTDKLLPLLKSGNTAMQRYTFEALATIPPPAGGRAEAFIDELLPLVDNQSFSVRRGAISALAVIPFSPGPRATSVFDKLLPLIGDESTVARRTMIKALTAAAKAEPVNTVFDKLVPLLENADENVQQGALEILTAIPKPPGDAAIVLIEKMHPLLDQSNSQIQQSAANIIATIPVPPGEPARIVAAKLLPLLADFDSDLQKAGALALAGVPIPPGEPTTAAISGLMPLLEDFDSDVQDAAVRALAALAKDTANAGAILDALMPYLGVDNDGNVEQGIARALAAIPITPGERAQLAADRLLPLLASDDSDTQFVALQAFAVLPVPADERRRIVIAKLLSFMESDGNKLRQAATRALSSIGPGGILSAVDAIQLIDTSAEQALGRLRAIAHLATGADEKKEQTPLLLSWLGRPAEVPTETVANNPENAHRVLKLLLSQWSEISKVALARTEAEARVMDIIYAACRAPAQERSVSDMFQTVVIWLRNLPLDGPVQSCWTYDERRTVEQLQAKFKEKGSTHAQALADHLDREKAAPWYRWISWSVAGWAVFWGAFLFVFPWSTTVQAIFFWNPHVRSVMSLWFVPLLLLIFPFLRRRLLKPFHDELLAAARPDKFAGLGYFGGGRARVEDDTPASIDSLITGLRGTVIVRGEAGLGKTSTLRRIALNTRGPVAFLDARDCTQGVDVAIGEILHQVQEVGFIRSMVYSRAMTVIVDGLNEVSADTREKVSTFARDMSKGDVFIGTQPIEWVPPKGAKIVDLLPLNRTETQEFLMSRPVGSDQTQKRHGDAYKSAVLTFIHQALDQAPTEDERVAAALMLSNPFDLAFAADLLAQGTLPRATALIDAAFQLADEGDEEQQGYRAVNGQPFPLTPFGRHAVDMRLEDRNWFKPEEFPAEISSLLTWKLLVRRAVRGADKMVDRVQFRHDRVWDFFIAAAFSADPELWEKHIEDPRFRGAYLRIADTWEPAHAALVREKLIVKAAERGDHTTSDEFIRRLEKRRQAAITTPEAA